MSNIDEYSIFEGKVEEKAPMKERRASKRWIRCKEAEQIYSMGRTAITNVAKECKALHKVNGIKLIDSYQFDRYIESHRVG